MKDHPLARYRFAPAITRLPFPLTEHPAHSIPSRFGDRIHPQFAAKEAPARDVGASPVVVIDRGEVMACIAFGLLLATVVLVFGLLIAIGPVAGGPLR